MRLLGTADKDCSSNQVPGLDMQSAPSHSTHTLESAFVGTFMSAHRLMLVSSRRTMQPSMPRTAWATWPPSRSCLKSATGSAVDTCSGNVELSGSHVLSGHTQQLLQIADNCR